MTRSPVAARGTESTQKSSHTEDHGVRFEGQDEAVDRQALKAAARASLAEISEGGDVSGEGVASARSVTATAVDAGRDCRRSAGSLQSTDQAHNQSAQ